MKPATKLLILLLVGFGSIGGSSAIAATTTTKTVDITVTHAASCANGPQIVTDKSNYAPRETVTVTTTCGSGNPKDWVYIVTYYNGISSLVSYYAYLGVSTANATVKLPAPNVISDRDQQYVVVWSANDGFNEIARSLPFTINKTISPPAPTATLRVSLAADPFTPAHV